MLLLWGASCQSKSARDTGSIINGFFVITGQLQKLDSCGHKLEDHKRYKKSDQC